MLNFVLKIRNATVEVNVVGHGDGTTFLNPAIDHHIYG